MKREKWIIPFILISLIFIMGSLDFNNASILLMNIFSSITKFLLPWIFLYWLIRYVKAIENQNYKD